MTFCPEWLTGSPNLDTSNPLFLWVYLFVSFSQVSTVSYCVDQRVLRSTVHEYDVSILYRIVCCYTDAATTSWVVMPISLMIDSYGHIAGTMRAAKTASKKPKRA